MTITTCSRLNFTICTYTYILFHNITQFSEGHSQGNTLRDHNVKPQTMETVKASVARHSHVNMLVTSTDKTLHCSGSISIINSQKMCSYNK